MGALKVIKCRKPVSPTVKFTIIVESSVHMPMYTNINLQLLLSKVLSKMVRQPSLFTYKSKDV